MTMRLSLATAALFVAGSVLADSPDPDAVAFFETKIRPVLVNECYSCHSNETGNARGGLRLDTRQLTRIGGSSGPAVVPGQPEESLLYTAITHQDFVMPPKRKLAPEVIADFRHWIETGAVDPRETEIVEIKATIGPEDIRTARETFWAYQPPAAPKLPEVRSPAWPTTEIDRFVLARLESAGMQPSADAAAAPLLRRLFFDLVGLPPTPRQLTAFESQYRSDPQQAVEDVVAYLLRQPQYGERWGRHWLDVVRYAESTGREVNMTYPHAWRYRDYVIDSFNADKPFDRFVQEQIAGDLLPAADDAQWAEQLIGTTFLALGPKNVNEQNRVQFAADLVDEQIDTTTRVFLGTSVACARCHDHKFDAIPQTDYYAMAGIFGSMKTYFGNPPSSYGSFRGAQTRRNSSLLLLPVEDERPVGQRYTAAEIRAMQQQMEDLQEEAAAARRNRAAGDNQSIRNFLRLQNQLAQLSAKLAVVDEQGRPRSYCMGVQEADQVEDARVLIRGEIDQPGQRVARGVPQVLATRPLEIDEDSSGRLELARWIGSDRNPLTARVMVNRIWQSMMGRALVTTTDNFGASGAEPTHPELLDYLADRFVQSGWSVKQIVADIASSRIYRASTEFDPDNHRQDPDNELLWRAHPRRLNAESIRDAMLQVSGELDLRRPAASVVAQAGYVRVRDGVLGDPREQLREQAEQIRAQAMAEARSRFTRQTPAARFRSRGSTDMRSLRQEIQREVAQRLQRLAQSTRDSLQMTDAKYRSVYLPIVRDQQPRSLDVFDFADPNAVVGTRESSSTSNQALYMMNNPFVIQQSERFAARLLAEASDPEQRVELAFQLAFARSPSDGELAAALRLVNDFSTSTESPRAWSVLCQSLFAAAEFRYLD